MSDYSTSILTHGMFENSTSLEYEYDESGHLIGARIKGPPERRFLPSGLHFDPVSLNVTTFSSTWIEVEVKK